MSNLTPEIPQETSIPTNSSKVGIWDSNKPYVSPVFCDKLSLTLKLTNDQLHLAKEKLEVLMEMGWARRIYSSKYEMSCKFGTSPSWSGSLIEVSAMRLDLIAKSHGQSDFRLEINPHKSSLTFAAEVCNTLIPNFGKHLIKNGSVTRIDLAVDVFPLKIDDVEINCKYFQMSSRHYNKSGALETLNFGADKGFVVYDKYLEATKNHMVGKDGPPSGTVRFEHRFKLKPAIRFCELDQLPNRFERVSIASAPLLLSKQDDHPEWFKFWQDTVRHRGLKPALKRIESKSYLNYATSVIEASSVEFWNPASIWMGYPNVLNIFKNLTSTQSILPIHPLLDEAI